MRKYLSISNIISVIALICSLTFGILMSKNQQAFQKRIEQEALEKQSLQLVKNIVAKNASIINVTAHLELSNGVDREVVKNLLTLHTENYFHYRGIKNLLDENTKKRLEKNLNKIQSMFLLLTNNKEKDSDVSKYFPDLYSFSDDLTEEIDRLLIPEKKE